MIKFFDKLTDNIADSLLSAKKTTNKIRRGVKGKYNLMFDENHITPKEQIKRLSLCSTCPQNINKTCQLCGCPIKSKSKLKESKGGECPLHKWKQLNN